MSRKGMFLSVNAIVHDPQGRVLLLKRSKASRVNSGKWDFPGGKIEPGETFDAALLREVQEETGLTVDLIGSFGTCESKMADMRIVYLVMEAAAAAAAPKLSPEHDEAAWVPPEKFGDYDFAPHFRRIAQRYAQEVAANPRVAAGPTSSPAPDLFKDSAVKPANLETQVQQFIDLQDRLNGFAKYLKEFLLTNVKALLPMAEVSARAKDPVSFAGKLIKKNKYTDPFKQVTDLVGARVVVHLGSEVDAVCAWIEKTFEVDRANSGDKLKDLGADKFGYRSVHFVVGMLDGKPEGAPREFVGLKAEIQVRTIAQHAWSDIGHDRVYKADCEIPDYWKREANRISALLEAADVEFARLVNGLAAYQDHSRNFPDDVARRQLALWNVVRRKLPKHPGPASRVARIALELQEWSTAIQVVKEFKGTLTPELQTSYGYALCKTADHPYAAAWRDGIAALDQAAEASGKVPPLLRLAELLAPHDRERALHYYKKAFALDSSNPATLVGHIRCEILTHRSTAFIPLLRPDIEQAIKRSEELAAAEADLPRPFYRIAGFLLLLGLERANESLAMLARAVHYTSPKAPDPMLQALKDISQLAEFEPARPDIECARRFLTAAFQAKCSGTPWPDGIARLAAQPLTSPRPFVIIAGGCDARHETAMQAYKDLLARAFAQFEGTLICGGTTQGISGVVGELAAASKGRIRAVGYLPSSLPTDGSATVDNRYELRRTDGGNSFTAREPIQNWLDLLATGVHPSQVRLLGINGGNVAGLEYRLAVALGASVGVIEGSGREAERVANDWPAVPRPDSSPKLVVLPPDPMTLRAFVGLGIEDKTLPGEVVDDAARLTHQMFLDEQRYKHSEPVMQPWPALRDDLQLSNRNQIAYLVAILRSAGFGVQPQAGELPNDPQFTEDEIKLMGEMEHGRWNVERLTSGWKFAKAKDTAKKLSPHLIPWEKLAPDIQSYDLKNVRLWPQVLAEVGYEIVRKR